MKWDKNRYFIAVLRLNERASEPSDLNHLKKKWIDSDRAAVKDLINTQNIA